MFVGIVPETDSDRSPCQESSSVPARKVGSAVSGELLHRCDKQIISNNCSMENCEAVTAVIVPKLLLPCSAVPFDLAVLVVDIEEEWTLNRPLLKSSG